MVPIGKHICLMREVGSARINEIDARQLIFLGNCLRPEMLLHRDRIVCSPLYGAIVRHNHTHNSLDHPNASDNSSRRYVVSGVNLMASKLREF
jgi:hypothetical protein